VSEIFFWWTGKFHCDVFMRGLTLPEVSKSWLVVLVVEVHSLAAVIQFSVLESFIGDSFVCTLFLYIFGSALFKKMSSVDSKYFGPLLFASSLATFLMLNACSAKKSTKSSGSSAKAQSSSAKASGKSSEPPKVSLPVIDFRAFNDREANPQAYLNECLKAAQAFHKYGCCVVRDPRVNEAHNERFLDMLEQYFEKSDGVRDARPEIGYQVGVTPEFVERPRDHCRFMGAFGPDNKPLSLCPPELDPKWRFFWSIGQRPEKTKYPSLNMDPVIPVEFPQWKEVMDMWGTKMIEAVNVLAEMTANGFGMAPDTFTRRMRYGSHLLAPTGSNFNKFGEPGRVLAGFHYDLNFMTIHGKSRFPGLYIWTREGAKLSVSMPDGCLLVQAGKQLEYLTGGEVLAGFHEVVVSPATVDAISRRKANGQSLWRVSSTLFSHIGSDEVLQPLSPFDQSAEAVKKYPPVDCGEQVRQELIAINLEKSN
jgi:isopenicillin N synthase-like dioxygenase